MPKKSRKVKPQEVSLTIPKLSGIQLGVMFVSFLLVHALVLNCANKWFPNQVALGNHFFSSQLALMYSAVALTIITVGITPIIEHFTDLTKTKLSDLHWVAIFFEVNLVSLWVLSRFAEWLGMGLQSWQVIVVLSLVIDVLQGLAVKLIVSRVR